MDDTRQSLSSLAAGLTLTLLTATGCGEPLAPLRPGELSSGGPDASITRSLTYHEDVRPILVERCTTCHRPGGIAPFSLQTYEEVVAVADRVQQVTHDRIMPPFLADTSGDCNEWANDRSLTDAQIGIIGAWVDQGTPRGDPTIPEPTPPEPPTLPSIDLQLQMPLQYAIDQGVDDDYRCFVVDTELTAPSFVTGYDVHAGNAQRVHHVIVYDPATDAAADQARALDAAQGDPVDGYACFGGASVAATPIATWAPGQGAATFPTGTGIELTPGRPLIIQVHYNNLDVEGSETSDRTSVDLSLSDTAEPAQLVLFNNADLALPPRMSRVEVSVTEELSDLPLTVRVWGILPHMHTLGRSLRIDVHRGDGDDQCAIDIPRWDFDWQLVYWLAQPMRIRPGDSATLTCVYDTSSRDEVTTFGERTLDEMCLAYVYVTL